MLATRTLSLILVAERDTVTPYSFVARIISEQIKSKHSITNKKNYVASSIASVGIKISNFNFIIRIVHARDVDRSVSIIEILGAILNRIIDNVGAGTKPNPKHALDAEVTMFQPGARLLVSQLHSIPLQQDNSPGSCEKLSLLAENW